MLACMACGGVVEFAAAAGATTILSVVAIMWDRVRLFVKRRPRGAERLSEFIREDKMYRLGWVRGSYPMYRIFYGE